MLPGAALVRLEHDLGRSQERAVPHPPVPGTTPGHSRHRIAEP
jgi:hypothetical protein